MVETGIAPPALQEAHAALHERLLAKVEDLLVFAVALDFGSALEACRQLGEAIDRHRKAEEQALSALPEEPPLPRGAGVALVVAEHDKLDELIGRAAEVLRALLGLDTHEDARRVALVRHLEPLIRVRGLLEHHTQREVELVYPHLEDHLPVVAREQLVRSITALLAALSAERPDA